MFDRNPQDNLRVITYRDSLPLTNLPKHHHLRCASWQCDDSTPQRHAASGSLRWSEDMRLKALMVPFKHFKLTNIDKHWQTACLQKCWLFERLAPTWRSKHEAKATRDDMDEPWWACLTWFVQVQLSKSCRTDMQRNVETGAMSHLGVIATWTARVSTDAQITSQSLGEHVSTEHRYWVILTWDQWGDSMNSYTRTFSHL